MGKAIIKAFRHLGVGGSVVTYAVTLIGGVFVAYATGLPWWEQVVVIAALTAIIGTVAVSLAVEALKWWRSLHRADTDAARELAEWMEAQLAIGYQLRQKARLASGDDFLSACVEFREWGDTVDQWITSTAPGLYSILTKSLPLAIAGKAEVLRGMDARLESHRKAAEKLASGSRFADPTPADPPTVLDDQIWGARQRAHLAALLREREGYAATGKWPRVREVDAQIFRARDDWWEAPEELAAIIQDGKDLCRKWFDLFGAKVPSDFHGATDRFDPDRASQEIADWTNRAAAVVWNGFEAHKNLFDVREIESFGDRYLRDYLNERLRELELIQERST